MKISFQLDDKIVFSICSYLVNDRILYLRNNYFIRHRFERVWREEDEVLWPHRPEERYGEKIDAREDGRQAEKGQTSNDLVPGF